MSERTILSYAITILGFFLCGFSMLFIFRGIPMAGDRGVQVVKYKGLEMRTNSLIMLLIVSVVVALAPLGLTFYRPCDDKAPTGAQSTKLFISGFVADQEGQPIEGAKVTLLDIDNHVLAHNEVGGDGSFFLEPELKGPGYKIKLRTEKEGYRPQNLILGVSNVTFPSVLIPASKHP